MYDLIIIGAGPAGLSAAIYASRARLSAVVIEQNFVNGGQIIDTYEIDNYPGLPGISGMDLAAKMAEHAEKLGVETVYGFVQNLDLTGPVKKVETDEGTYEAKAVIIASGATHSKLGAQGENQFAGMGVSYCATCDGAFYRGKDVLVVGGGDVAVEDAIFLARGCNKVYVVHRRDELRAAKILQESLLSLPNVEMVWNSNLRSVNGGMKVESATVVNKLDQSELFRCPVSSSPSASRPAVNLPAIMSPWTRRGTLLPTRPERQVFPASSPQATCAPNSCARSSPLSRTAPMPSPAQRNIC